MPFCSNCGKEHSIDAKFCTNCGNALTQHTYNKCDYQLSQQQYIAQPDQTFTPEHHFLRQQEVKGVYGLGKAITGMVFATIAFILSICAIACLSTFAEYNFEMGYYSVDEDLAFACLFFSLIATPFSIISVVFGGRSISNFKYAKRNLNRVPVPTLVIGIHSLVIGIIACLYTFISFVEALAIL